MSSINIRKVVIGDIDTLLQISRQTFLETFSASNSAENMKDYLDGSLSKEKLTAELNDENAAFYFATLENQVIGYLKLNFGASQTELKDENAIEIERIYASKEFLGKGVGKLLYDKAMDVARQKGSDYIWLGVWEENARAISFYRKIGFVEFGRHIFRLGNDEQTDLMMKLKLKD